MASKSDIAIDGNGRRLPMTPAEVAQTVRTAMEKGELVCCVCVMPNGDLAVPVVGGPSLEAADMLEAAARGIRRACAN